MLAKRLLILGTTIDIRGQCSMIRESTSEHEICNCYWQISLWHLVFHLLHELPRESNGTENPFPCFPYAKRWSLLMIWEKYSVKIFLLVSETNLNFLSSLVTSSTECFVVKVMYNRWNFLSTQFICYILLFCSFHIFANHTFLLKVLISLCTIKFCYSDDFSFSILMFRGIFDPEIYIHGALSWPPLTHFICRYSYSPNCSPYFPKVLTERICLTIRSFLNWWSFQTFLIGDTVRRN